MMKVHHLNCGNIQGFRTCGHHVICHCLLIETPSSGLVLVDTGLGHQDLIDPVPRLGWDTRFFGNPKLDPKHSALSRVKTLGFKPTDVKHIILTHLDYDHVGGLVDFPGAAVHVHETELKAALNPTRPVDRARYKPRLWEHVKFETYSDSGESWKNFGAIRDLKGLPPEILLVPTHGHTRGHTAVAVRGPRKWLLHAGDAYFDEREVHQEKRQCEPLLEALQLIDQVSMRERLKNQERLRQLALTDSEVKVFCAHSPREFEKLKLGLL